MFVLTKPKDSVSLEISDPSFGSLTLIAQPPTYAQLIFVRDAFRQGGGTRDDALVAVIVDWRDVNDEQGKPVRFSRENFASACAQFPILLSKAADFATDVIFGTATKEEKEAKETQEKNLNAPPSMPSSEAK